MSDLAPRIEASHDLERGLVKFAASGLFGEEQVAAGAAKIGAAAAPFIAAKKPFSILADYSEAIVQSQASAVSIRESFAMAKELGLQRIAVLNAPMLVRLQYKRLADMVEIEFFEAKVDAMGWLREVQAPA